MIPSTGNLRDMAIAVAAGSALAWLLSGCAPQSQPPPMLTITQLAPEPEPTPASTPRITGADILAQQPPEIQQAIRHGQPWPTFRWPHERMVPYTEHMAPLTIDLAPYHDVDLAFQPGDRFAGTALGDGEQFIAGRIRAQVLHEILKCKIPGTETNGAFYTMTRIYPVHLRCGNKTTLNTISFYDPEQVLAAMHAADAAPQESDPTAMPTPSRLDRAYKIDGPNGITWKPVSVANDGIRTYIALPATPSPIAPAVFGDDGSALNYRFRNQTLVVDALFNRAQLVDGDERVTITRVSQ